MKFLHCSDLHLGRRPAGGQGDYSRKRYEDFFAAFDRLIDIGIREKAEVMLITGDLFDRRELGPRVLEDAEKLLQKLHDAGIRLLITEGNHDNITRGREEDSWLLYLEGKSLLTRLSCSREEEEYTFIPFIIEETEFYGLGYPGAFVNETLSALAEELDTEGAEKRVILIHTAISRGDFLPGTVDPETIDLFRGKTAYIAGGHFHSFSSYPEDAPFFFIPGAPEYWDMGEKGKRGAILFDTDTENGEYKFIPSVPRNRVELKMTVDCGNRESFRGAFLEKLNAKKITDGEDILMVSIKQKLSFFIDSGWCEEEGRKAGALKTVVDISYPNNISTSGTNRLKPVAEIEEELIARWEIFGEKKELIARTLQKLKTHQQENNEELFFENFDAMLSCLQEEESV